MLDLFVSDTDRRAAAQTAAANPVQALDPGFAGAFEASWNAVMAQQSLITELGLREEVIQGYLDRYFEATGQAIENPRPGGLNPEALPGAPNLGGMMGVTPVGTNWSQARQIPTLAAVRDRYNAWAAEAGEELFPTDEEIEDLVRQRRIDLFRESQQQLAGVRTGGAAIGSFLGTMAGSLADPVTLSTLSLGAAWSSGILRTMLVEAGVGFGTSIATDVANLSRIQEVNPEFGGGEILANALLSAGGGAVLGGGIKGFARLFGALRGAGVPLPRRVVDAGNTIERAAAGTTTGPTPQAARAQEQSVAQMALDLGNDRPVQSTPAAAAASGTRTGTVYDGDGRAVEVEYVVVPAASLRVSHNPDFSVNPDYPGEYQPRDRTRVASQDQVGTMAANLNPDLLMPGVRADSGPPVIAADGVVESGNARVMAIMQAYRDTGRGSIEAPANRYRQRLEDAGFDTTGIEAPVLVARRLTALDPKQRVAFVTAANRTTAARMGAAETAGADARLLDEALLSRLVDGDIAGAANRNFVQGFVKKLPATERGPLLDKDGFLSTEGRRRIEAALLARAFGDPTLLARSLEDVDNNIRTIAGAMADASPAWSIMRDAVKRGEIPAGMDITKDVLEALRTITRARDAGRPVREFADQGELLGGPSEISKIILRAIFNDGAMRRQAARSRISALLRGYADESRKNLAGERLFGEPLSAEEVLTRPLRDAGRADLADAAAVARERAATPAAIEKIEAEPANDEALFRAAEELTIVRPRAAAMPVVPDPPPFTREMLRAEGPDGPHFVQSADNQRFLAVDGSPDLGAVPATGNVAAGPVRLRRETIGHIDNAPHRQQAQAFGYRDGLHLALDVIRNWEQIRAARDGKIALVKAAGDDLTTAVAELARVEGTPYWRVVSTSVRRAEQLGETIHVRERTPETATGEQSSFIRPRREAGGGGEFAPSVDGDPNVGVFTLRVKKGEGVNGEEIYEDVPLQQLLDDADAEIAAARDVEACATGAPLPSEGED